MRRALGAALALAVAACAFAARAETPKDAEYLALAGAAKKDWCAIRRLYPETSFYAAHRGLEAKEATLAAGKRMLMEKTPDAVAAFRDHMRRHAGSAGAHFYAAYLYNWNNDLVSQRMDALLPDFGRGVDYIDPLLEKQAADALLGCITAGGDGRSSATAFEIVTMEEMEIVIEKYFHVEPVKASAKREDGRFFHVVRVRIPDSKTEADLHFRLAPQLVQGIMARQKELREKAAAAKP